jgi:hypothetical protein
MARPYHNAPYLPPVKTERPASPDLLPKAANYPFTFRSPHYNLPTQSDLFPAPADPGNNQSIFPFGAKQSSSFGTAMSWDNSHSNVPALDLAVPLQDDLDDGSDSPTTPSGSSRLGFSAVQESAGDRLIKRRSSKGPQPTGSIGSLSY